MATTMAEPVAKRIAEELRAQFAEGLDAPDWRRLSRATGIARRQMERLFRTHFLTSPMRFWADLRSAEAEALLRGGHDVLDAAVRAGFSGPGRLHDAVVARRGVTPGELRSGGRGLRIAVGTFDTPLGWVLLAATARGLCALRLCTLAPAREVLAELKSEFPHASFEEDTQALQGCADALVAFLENRADRFDPQLDVHGTAFQRAVWEELRRIPAGETRSYGEIAARIGHPKAARAVGQACARNSVSIAIPCHRALGADGSLTGFRWGAEWKKRLLELERARRS